MLNCDDGFAADPSSSTVGELAEGLFGSKAYDDAIAVCRAGLAEYSEYVRLRELLGRALLELNRLDEAVAEFEVVRVSAPNNLVAGRGLADVQQRGGAAAAGLDGAGQNRGEAPSAGLL